MKYILISGMIFIFCSCSETIYSSLNSEVVNNCRNNPNISERRSCEMNSQRSFSEYEQEIKTKKSGY